MAPIKRTPLLGFLIAVTASLSPSPARGAENVQVTVLAILASSEDDKITDCIKEIAQAIRSKEKQLTHFELQRTFKESIGLGKSVTIKLVDEVTMELTVNEKTDCEGRIKLSITPPKMGELTYSCSCGKYFPIATDYYTANKERLFIAVMAKPCFKGKDKKK
jgi:uncharacterized protein VirK/YbjX